MVVSCDSIGMVMFRPLRKITCFHSRVMGLWDGIDYSIKSKEEYMKSLKFITNFLLDQNHNDRAGT